MARRRQCRRSDEAEADVRCGGDSKLNVELHPKVPPVHYTLGEVYRRWEKRDLALQSYARALELNPGNPGPVADRLKEMLGK